MQTFRTVSMHMPLTHRDGSKSEQGMFLMAYIDRVINA